MFMFDGGIGQIIYLIFFFIFIFFYSRIMVMQVMFKLERSAEMLEGLSRKGKNIVLKKIKKRPDKKIRDSVNQFLEFFMITPVSLDPYGIVRKFEHLIDLEKDRFKYFVNQLNPKANEEEKANIMMGLSGAMSLHQIAKIVRHYVELIKNTKSYNLALIVQMQIPLIERMAKGLLKGTEALANGWVVGDGLGPLVATQIIDNSKTQKVDDETLVCRKKYKNRDIIIIKAKGPGGRTGNIGRVLDKIGKKEKITKIITIDAAAKLEGEKTGSIAEGIGVACGGIGVERAYIENFAVKNKIPLDTIIVKMSQEEAIMPMREEILNAVDKVISLIDNAIKRTKQKGKIIIIGVGNTSGIGNTKKEADKARPQIIKISKKLKAIEEKEKKKRYKLFPF